MKVPPSCDIFCAVIDNYGDIGVSWRLARQLALEYGIEVRLWVDALEALQRIWPAVDATASAQRCAGVEIRRWTPALPTPEPAAVVVEAFGCELPPVYVEAMLRSPRRPVWLNLEYLSAESWVADCHGLASPQRGGALQKYFFFPGFSAATGGLLLERDLLASRSAFQCSPAARSEFFSQCGLGEEPRGMVVSLFAYENAALPPLLEAWTSSTQPIVCLVPEGRLLAAIGRFFGESAPIAGAVLRRGMLTVMVLPFLTQLEYDRLLWSCDLNFVRGEDSFVRAQWAARPFVWHIYPQADGAHWPKLNAFLQLYCAALPAPAAAALAGFWQAWNGRGDIAIAWRALELQLPALRERAQTWCAEQAERGNLAAALVQFCANHV